MLDFQVVDCISDLTALGESPVWSPLEACLYFVDILNAKIIRYDPLLDQSRYIQLNEHIGSIALRQNGGFLAAMRTGIYLLSPDGRIEKKIIENHKNTAVSRFNDGCVDYWGNFCCGTIWEDDRTTPQAKLFRLDSSLKYHEIDLELGIVNGIAFSAEGDQLYYSDSAANEVYRYHLDATTGQIASQRELFVQGHDQHAHHYFAEIQTPDGAIFDVNQNYWSAQYDGAAIICLSQNRQVLHQVPLQAEHPTKIAFGGIELNTMFVTTAQSEFLAQTQYPHSGRLLMAETSFQGNPTPLLDY